MDFGLRKYFSFVNLYSFSFILDLLVIYYIYRLRTVILKPFIVSCLSFIEYTVYLFSTAG